MQEWLKRQGANPRELEQLSPLLQSSLWATVARMEVHYAEISQGNPTILLPTGEQRRVRTPRDRISDLAVITADPEYAAIREHILGSAKERFNPEEETEEATQSLTAYTEFLVSEDTSQAAKLYVASPNFTTQIKDQSKYHSPGPYFRRVLQGLSTDGEAITFVHPNLKIFAELDEAYFKLKHLQEDWKKEPQVLQEIYGEQYRQNAYQAQRAFEQFTGISRELLDTAFNPDDKSQWRSFLMQNFAIIAGITSLMGHTVESYNPYPQLERIKKLSDTVTPADWSLLGMYLFSSSWASNEEAKRILDQEVARGNMRRAEIFTLFHINHRGRNPGLEVLVIEDELVKFWQKEYLEGRVRAQDFLTIPGLIRKVRSAVLALPKGVARDVLLYGDSLENTSNGLEIKKPLFTRELLEDGDLIITLVTAGISPRKDIRDRLRNDPVALSAICEFGKSLFPVAQNGITPFAVLTQYWTEKFLSGEITQNELQETCNSIVIILTACSKFLSTITEDQILKVKEKLGDLVSSLSDAKDRENVIALLDLGIFPTPSLRKFIKDRDEEGLQDLKDLSEQTKKGNFDPANPVQRDLEYMHFLGLGGRDYQQFVSLPIQTEERQTSITFQEQREAEAAAFEAAHLYHFIKQRADTGRNITVVGNRRYGDLFVVAPLTDELNQLGVQTRYDRVSSSGTTESTAGQVFPKAFVNTIKEAHPDIVIVDGTASPFADKAPRYPGAMLGYLNWFLAYNEAAGVILPEYSGHIEKLRERKEFQELVEFFKGEGVSQGYKITYWLPFNAKSDHIVVGSLKVPYIMPDNQSPQVIFANPVIDPKKVEKFSSEPVLRDHAPGFFDDPEIRANRSELFFGEKGVEKIIFGKTEEEFVQTASNHIYYALPQMIRLADNVDSN